MKIRLLRSATILIIAVVLLTGCNNGGGTTPTPTPTPSTVVLRWWNMFDTPADVKPLIDAYQALHPNVTIQYSQLGLPDDPNDPSSFVDRYIKKLDTAINSGDPNATPDIFTINNNSEGKYEKAIMPETLTALSTDIQTNLNDLYPVVKTQFFKNNNIYGLPMYMDALAIIYNTDLFSAYGNGDTVPSQQWQGQGGLLDQAQTLTQRDPQGNITRAGFSAAIPSNAQFYFDLLNVLFLQDLQSTETMVDTSGKVNLTTGGQGTEIQAAINYYKGYIASGGSWDANQKKDIAAFLEKKLVMYVAPSWRLINILQYNQKYNLGLNVAVKQLPQIAGAVETYWPTYWVQTVSKNSNNPSVAWDFLNFITQKNQVQLLDTTVKSHRPIGIISPLQSMASSISGDHYLGAYVQSLPKARSWDMYDGATVKQCFDNYMNGKITDLKALEGNINAVKGGNLTVCTP